MKKVLITGMSGLIGGILREHLESVGGYELSALNRRAVEGVECIRADMTDPDAIKPAFAGKDVVVHLAAYTQRPDWEFQLGNIVGTYNVYEAARQAGVQRIVFGSSGATVMGYERRMPYESIIKGRYKDVPDDFPRLTEEAAIPGGIYGAYKLFGEALGRHFSDSYGISVLCVRIGRVNQENRPTNRGEMSRYLSHHDIAQVLRLCIDARPSLAYDVFYATSNNRWGYRDLEHAKEVLGYQPRDSADAFDLGPPWTHRREPSKTSHPGPPPKAKGRLTP
jgi:nucleoside-diphosphate-sugar epimerase